MSNRYHQLKVAVLVTDGFEQAELLEPKKAAATSRACQEKGSAPPAPPSHENEAFAVAHGESPQSDG
ncbi:hypothetical protein [Herbaspirillum rubrisubalbicans]|uniref:hypothetical protein n=1 Tax=Herbaspirillum rubrisubalbicans TaxID=80842 RepID=UPI000A94FC4E|nr:hypothetical protein [Herbaspirillum rubrisubalbicans]